MKKKLLVLGLSISIMLVGCNNSKSSTNKTKSDNTDGIVTQEKQNFEKRENATFRNSVWGDNSETVKKYESDIKLESDGNGNLVGETTVSTNEAYAVYWFNSNDSLYRGTYGLIPKQGVGEGYYISVYNSLKEDLTSIYGDPVSDEIIPLTDQKQIDYTGEENSLRYGYTAYKTIWNTDTTEIMLGMSSQNFEVNTLINYTDINFEEDLSDSGL